MRDADFHDLVTMLDQNAGQTHGAKPHTELVELVRTHFPARTAGRYRPLASDLLAMQEDDTPLYRISPRYEDNEFNSRFGEARRGNEKRFRALLLKWLWAHHHDEATAWLDRWGVSVPERANKRLCRLSPMMAEMLEDASLRELSFRAMRAALSRDHQGRYSISPDRVEAILR